jgi:hypothetical protein
MNQRHPFELGERRRGLRLARSLYLLRVINTTREPAEAREYARIELRSIDSGVDPRQLRLRGVA